MSGMNHVALTGLVAIGLATCSASGSSRSDPIADQGILELAPGANLQAVLDRYGFSVLDEIPSRGIYLVSLGMTMSETQFEMLFLLDPDVSDSDLNYESGDPDLQTQPGTQSIFLAGTAGDFQNQPARAALGLPSAHTIATGSGVTVAVVDTGVDASHPLLTGAVAPGGLSLIGDPQDTADSGNGIDDDGDGAADNFRGHGTFVASLVRMVAPDAQILPIRVMDDEGRTTQFLVAKGIYHAIDAGADVINISLGAVEDVKMITDAAEFASDLGIIVTASSGNAGTAAVEFPAATNKVAAVAATDVSGQRAGFSNHGDETFIATIGVDLTAATPGGQFGKASGTSFAAPLLAGTAALMIERGVVLRWNNFREMARETARDAGPMNPGLPDDALGFGLLDLPAAMAWQGPCFADLVEDDQLNIDDVIRFIEYFTSPVFDEQGEYADYAEPRGVRNIDDVLAFVNYFAQGCAE